VSYATPQALGMALEQRLLRHSIETVISLNRLCRQVVLQTAAPPARLPLQRTRVVVEA
jgi:hypothetical protein